jgi:hypothetical protein
MEPGDQVILGVAELAGAAENARTDAGTRSLAMRALQQIYRFGDTSMGGAVEREQLLRTTAAGLDERPKLPRSP